MNWYYGAKWGLTDLYPDVEKEVRQLIDSGQEFDRISIDCKKEITGWSISCDGRDYTISVWSAMDDVPDIILDADHGEELTEEEVADVADMLWQDVEFTTELSDSFKMPLSSSLEDICARVNSVGAEQDKELKGYFTTVNSIVDFIIAQRN